MGWLPYLIREEFDQYRARHLDLEPFPLYDFGALRHTSEKEPDDGGGVLRGHSPYVSDLGKWPPVSKHISFLYRDGYGHRERAL